MKFTVNKLKLGDTVDGEVVESISYDHIIVNFNGDLLRVENQSSRQFQPGAKIKLIVARIQPLGFHLAPPALKNHLDVSV